MADQYMIDTGKGSSVGTIFRIWVKAIYGEGIYHVAIDNETKKTKCGRVIGKSWKRFPRLSVLPPIPRPRQKACLQCKLGSQET